jgi:regulator of ribonuclease activity A
MNFSTADLCDENPDDTRVAESVFLAYGGRPCFHGELSTVRVERDFLLVKEALAGPGTGRVLAVDGGGHRDHALLGDRLAAMAAANGWAGVIVNGMIRDSAEIAAIDIGVRALGTCPRRPDMQGRGAVGETLCFAGIEFTPGHHVYVDADGIVVSRRPLAFAV